MNTLQKFVIWFAVCAGLIIVALPSYAMYLFNKYMREDDAEDGTWKG